MNEILPGVFHWTTFHEGIQSEVHSCLVTATDPAVLIDPREPVEGMDWFRNHGPPVHAYLTNRHHYRHSDRFAREFGTLVWCHSEGLHEFGPDRKVRSFEHGEVLPGPVTALEVGVLCPEETALLIPAEGGIVALGDAVIGTGKGLGFVPDFLMGDDPGAVKRGLRKALARLLELDFRHLLLAHGEPLVGDGRDALRRFLNDSGS